MLLSSELPVSTIWTEPICPATVGQAALAANSRTFSLSPFRYHPAATAKINATASKSSPKPISCVTLNVFRAERRLQQAELALDRIDHRGPVGSVVIVDAGVEPAHFALQLARTLNQLTQGGGQQFQIMRFVEVGGGELDLEPHNLELLP